MFIKLCCCDIQQQYKDLCIRITLMNANELVGVGLTKNQADIYLLLLRTPGKTGGEIAKKLSIDRSFAYSILNSLLDKGLVSYVEKEKRRVFFASEPENLLKEIDEKRNITLGVVEKLKSINPVEEEAKTTIVYEGKAGLKAYIREFLETDRFYTLGGGSMQTLFEKLKYQYPQYLKELNKKKIIGSIITSEESGETLKQIYKNSKVEIKTFKHLKSHVSFTIFSNKVAIYSAEEKPFVIIIKNSDVSSALKAYFDLLWGMNPKINGRRAGS